MDPKETLQINIAAAREVLAGLHAVQPQLDQAVKLIFNVLESGRKVLCCGNGGSAADAAHFAAEITGRYKIHRRGFPALNLTCDNSLITALINDYPPEHLFARQVEALGQPGDVLVALSTSGKSENVRLALKQAKASGLHRIAFLGGDGGDCLGLSDIELIPQTPTTARAQEAHLLLYHTICECLDPMLADLSKS